MRATKCAHRWAIPLMPSAGLQCERCPETRSFFEMSQKEAGAIEDQNRDREGFLDAFRECYEHARVGQARVARSLGEDPPDSEYD